MERTELGTKCEKCNETFRVGGPAFIGGKCAPCYDAEGEHPAPEVVELRELVGRLVKGDCEGCFAQEIGGKLEQLLGLKEPVCYRCGWPLALGLHEDC